MMANMKANQKMMDRTDANQAKVDDNLRDIRSIVNAWIADMKDGRKETMACQEKTKAQLECEEPTSVDMEPEAEHQEVPKEEAAVLPVGELRKRRRDWNLARSAARSQRKGPGYIVDPERD
jgi:hypothetical protein